MKPTKPTPTPTRPAWYGGNKIPLSYIRQFFKSVENEEIPHDLRQFMENLK